MSSKARQQRTVGEIVNLMSIDAQRLQDVVTWMYSIYTAPIQISLALGLLYRFLGPSIFAGFGAMVLLIPLNVVAAGRGKNYQVRGSSRVGGSEGRREGGRERERGEGGGRLTCWVGGVKGKEGERKWEEKGEGERDEEEGRQGGF